MQARQYRSIVPTIVRLDARDNIGLCPLRRRSDNAGMTVIVRIGH